ncbi:hypothetical protein [Cryobacterium sp. AP23]
MERFIPTRLEPRPVDKPQGSSEHYYYRVHHKAREYPGPEELVRTIREDLVEAKMDGRLPPKLRTRVSLNRRYHPRLSVTVAGLSRDELFMADSGQLYPEWALVLLQVALIAGAYESGGYVAGDEVGHSRYYVSFYVDSAGFYTWSDLASMVDGE